MADHMIIEALAAVRATLTRLEAVLGADALIPDSTPSAEPPPQAQQVQVVAFQTLQGRLAALEAWPEVECKPWLNEDSLGPHPLGAHLGDDFSAGQIAVCLDLEVDTAPWLAAVALGSGVSVPLAVLLEALPGALALLADERVGALLARDGWTIPAVLLPLLAQIPQGQGGRGA